MHLVPFYQDQHELVPYFFFFFKGNRPSTSFFPPFFNHLSRVVHKREPEKARAQSGRIIRSTVAYLFGVPIKRVSMHVRIICILRVPYNAHYATILW